MRIVMIHALSESLPPVQLAFREVFPEAEVVNLLDEGLFSAPHSSARRLKELVTAKG